MLAQGVHRMISLLTLLLTSGSNWEVLASQHCGRINSSNGVESGLERGNAATVAECARGREGPSAAQQEWGRRAMGVRVEIAPWGLAVREVSTRWSKSLSTQYCQTPDSVRLTSQFPRKYMSCIFIWGWGRWKEQSTFSWLPPKSDYSWLSDVLMLCNQAQLRSTLGLCSSKC